MGQKSRTKFGYFVRFPVFPSIHRCVNDAAQGSIADNVERDSKSPELPLASDEMVWQKRRLVAHFPRNPIVVIGDFDDQRNSDLQSFETPHEKMHFGGAPLWG